MLDDFLVPDVDALAARIPDGAKLAVYKDSAVAMAATRALVRRRARDLYLVTVPTSGFQAELLIAGGCVATIETSGVSMSEHGPAPAFVRAVKSGSVRILDGTCPAIYAQIQAAEKGIPFMPLRGIIGSDLLRHRDDWRVVDNPFADGDPIVALPAIVPDIALVHVARADRHGNLWMGAQREIRMLAHAARETLATVEEIVDEDFLADPETASLALPADYLTGLAVAPRGSWPLALPGRYGDDADYLAAYCQAARSEDGLAEWLEREVFGVRAAAE